MPFLILGICWSPGPRTHQAQQQDDLYCELCRRPRGTPAIIHKSLVSVLWNCANCNALWILVLINMLQMSNVIHFEGRPRRQSCSPLLSQPRGNFALSRPARAIWTETCDQKIQFSPFFRQKPCSQRDFGEVAQRQRLGQTNKGSNWLVKEVHLC